VSKQLIADIRVLSADLQDQNFLDFLSSLEKVIDAMIASGHPEPGDTLIINEDDDISSESHWERRDEVVGVRKSSLLPPQSSQSKMSGGEVLIVDAVSSSQVLLPHEAQNPERRRRRAGRLSSEATFEGQEDVSPLAPTSNSSPPPPVKPINPKNLRSHKVRQSLLPITEVVNIAEFEKFHSKRPNSDLLLRVSKRLEESIKEHHT
jgi:hypothetical protein